MKVGKEYWKLLASEHGLDFESGQSKLPNEENGSIHKVFYENAQSGSFIPRSIFMDANETSYENVFDKQSIANNCTKVLGSFDSSFNFAQGKYN